MRLLLATLGSRGDVEPFLCLARAARTAGHEVRVVVPDDADHASNDLDVASLGMNFSDLAASVDGGRGLGLRAFRERIRPAMGRALTSVVDAAMQWHPEIIVAHPKLLTVPVAAERLGIPFVWVELTPTLTPTREFPAAGIAARSLGPGLNRLSYRAVGLAGAMFASEIRNSRTRLGIPASTRLPSAAGSLAAISPSLLPRPSDWPPTTQITGDWRRPASQQRTPEQFQLNDDLQVFLADAAPFVYAGFGSMTGGDAAARAEAVIDGARQAGMRVLVATGWGGLQPPTTSLGPDVFVAQSVPHDALLPLAVAAIHHGGAGTVHAATRSGTPSIIVPFLADQPFWAEHLRRLGLAGTTLPRDRLTPDQVHHAITRATDHTSRVRDIARQMATEDGTATAIPLLTALT